VKAIVQPVQGGRVEILEVPKPTLEPTEVLVRTVASIISTGTEHAVTDLAHPSLLGKPQAYSAAGVVVEAGPAVGGNGQGGGDGRAAPCNNAAISLRFADGSLAAICYGSAQPKAGREWIEVTCGSRRLVIDDFRSVKADGRTLWRGRQDKGHRACASAFHSAVTGGKSLPTWTMLASTRATIQAAVAICGQ
jgi:predicted dehydrogenase